MNKKFGLILLHPVSLAFFITVIIILLFFPESGKYMLTLADHQIQKKDHVVYYDDLDGNGYSDRLYFVKYPNNISAVTVRLNPSSDLNEWPFRGSHEFSSDRFFITGDFDGKEGKEIYMFTALHDSLFLNGIMQPQVEKSMIFSSFICMIGKGVPDDQSHLKIIFGGFTDLNGDGNKELVFAVNFGTTGLPRIVYRYDIKNDLLMAGPKNGYHISNLTLTDLNNDGVDEIIVNGYASQNFKDSTGFPVDDRRCWLIVLDRNLHYYFKPRIFPWPGYSTLSTHVYHQSNGEPGMICWYGPPLKSGKSIQLMIFNASGRLVRFNVFSGINYDQCFEPILILKNRKEFLAVANDQKEILIFDMNLRLTDRTRYELNCYPAGQQDLDHDQQNEWLFMDAERNKLAVARQDLSNLASLPLRVVNPERTTFSLFKAKDQPTFISVDSGNDQYLLAYGTNPLYYTRWLMFAGIFLAMYLFTLLAARAQRLRIESRLKTEKKITELQLRIVRNQMDPHFTMNAVNSVIDAINREEKEEARDNLLHFSKMYRSLVLSADKIKRSLREEIEFTENYLALEQFRFRDRFRYVIEIHPDVDLSTEVPKMVIQSPVENAVKHGLQHMECAGEVRITIRNEEKNLVIEVADNGIGREASSIMGTDGTGKGMEVMNQFFDLYHRITGVTVNTITSDLRDEWGNATGTRVVVTIQ